MSRKSGVAELRSGKRIRIWRSRGVRVMEYFSRMQLVLATLLVSILWSCSGSNFVPSSFLEELVQQPELGTRAIPTLEREGYIFRDLNRDGRLNSYEDWRLSVTERAEDLLSRMTLEEKAGTLLHGNMSVFGAEEYDMEHAKSLILDNHVGSVITRLASSASLLAKGNNELQEMSEQRRLGIPLTISTDPRSHFNHLDGASISAGNFSKWPEALGLAAIGDIELVRQFADVARQEYRAVGIVQALSPMADLATEPRWPRVVGTFGEDSELVGEMVGAYVDGFQNGTNGLKSDSVATVVKHWAGYGAAKDGLDSHSYFGRFSAYPGGNFGEHLKPFEHAFEANTSGVMPSFSIPEDLVYGGEVVEQVGAGFSRFLLTDLLRDKYGFDGVILSDWGITKDCNELCIYGEVDGQVQQIADMSTAWGVIELSSPERYAKALDAGIDQFGGIDDASYLLDSIELGLVTEARIDESVRRILVQKFQLGLFENPFVDEVAALQIVGNGSFHAQAEVAQARALVLLENKKDILPLASSAQRVFLYGINPEIATSFGFGVVEDIEEADIAILRLDTPYEQPHSSYVFGRRHHEGNLAFEPGNPDYDAVIEASEYVPVIATVFLERPAIMTSIQNHVDALIGNFGVSDKVFLEVLLGQAQPEGALPIELPSSMEAVEAQYEDVASDSENPLYPIGYGLSYEN